MEPKIFNETSCDVAIVGGALSGAASALLLLNAQPQMKVLILEKSSAFGRRVGEATVEVSGYFLGRVLGLTQYLNENHLVKQGMRFWFYNDRSQALADCSELGGRYLARVPAYQIDRAKLDEEVLRRAKALGAEVWRPAQVSRIELAPGGQQTLEVRYQDEMRTVRARWVIDASGVAALLARQQGWWRSNDAHPTTAVWARWTGVKDWDGLELARKYPSWSGVCHGIRGTATNHFVGPGWWAWCIPLKGGDFSIGVVFDQRRVSWAQDGSLGQRLKDFLAQHPVARELMAEAVWREGDVHWRKNLPYCSTTFSGDGFALVGDAAAFLDPFYSPGMDWISFTVSAAAELVLAERRGADLNPLIERHNLDFGRSYHCWFEALYRDKYDYLGDFEFMRLAFLLDLGLYYLGVASQPFKFGPKALTQPVFSLQISRPFYHFMRAYNRRFAQMARARRHRHRWGAKNAGRRFLFGGYTFAPNSAFPIAKAMVWWALLEMTEGWRSWFGDGSTHSPKATEPLTASAVPAQAIQGSAASSSS